MGSADFGLSSVSGRNRLTSPPARTTVRVASRIVLGSLMRLLGLRAGARVSANSVPFNKCVPLGVVAPKRRLTAESVKVFPGCLVLRLINSFTIVASAMAPDSRSDEGAMLIHCDREATTKTGPFRRNPLGRWGLRAISSARFVGDERASPSSSLLDLASQAPSAMVKLFMRRNTSNRLSCDRYLVFT